MTKKNKTADLPWLQDASHFEFDVDYCEKAVDRISRIRKRLGINIQVHTTQEDTMQNGQIFLFNHFARFETLIPPYILMKETGALTRSVADVSLFQSSERLRTAMSKVGAVPNRLEGLLPFMAAEILRGRKVVLFPEGGMIKDRRVMDDEGEFGIFSGFHQVHRKHHRGAAVLALMLEIFKRRIIDVYDAGDERRIEHWRKSLGLASVAEMMEQARKPTLIVPSNITFYPIRVDDNILSTAASWLARSMPDSVKEEMVIEGNLLLKDTDMDIRMGTPFQPSLSWGFWKTFLLNRYFEQIDSLDDLFGLKDSGGRMFERVLVGALERETNRIRDQYMEDIYENITVNVAHLASVVLKNLYDTGEQGFRRSDVAKTIYLAAKSLQSAVGVHLHRSLVWPDRYRWLADGEAEDLKVFLDTAVKAGLIENNEDDYIFTDKFSEEFVKSSVRLEHPVQVYYNEVMPLVKVTKAVEKAMSDFVVDDERQWASHLMDDEEHAFQWNRRHFKKSRYLEINSREEATKSGAPYLWVHPKRKSKVGVLLVHGFLSSPAELKDFGRDLHAKGFEVLGMRLPGHGTSPWDLMARSREDWIKSVRRNYRILKAHVEHVVVVGFSTGGLLALELAAEQPEGLAGVIPVCAPLSVHDKNMAVVPMVNTVNAFSSWFTGGDGVVPFYPAKPENKDINYRSMPVKAINEFRDLMHDAPEFIQKVTAPLHVFQANDDPVSKAESAEKILKMSPSETKEFHPVVADRHTVLTHNNDKIWDRIASVIAGLLDEKGGKKSG
ncbi:MAG: alpha/beta fold hydrolase [Alphaproteobacteria bacterium]|nr:alpha/beta fold hydrolase [Alphaproteobacteria bacterium]